MKTCIYRNINADTHILGLKRLFPVLLSVYILQPLLLIFYSLPPSFHSHKLYSIHAPFPPPFFFSSHLPQPTYLPPSSVTYLPTSKLNTIDSLWTIRQLIPGNELTCASLGIDCDQANDTSRGTITRHGMRDSCRERVGGERGRRR